MTESYDGLQEVHRLISCPAQWHLLLALSAGPQSLAQLWRQLPGRARWHGLRALIGLWQHHLIDIDLRHGTWSLSASGRSLRPILLAIQTCARPTGGKAI